MQTDAYVKQKLLELKQIKRRRDIQLSTKIAMTRDRVWWMLSFYTTMGAVSLARVIIQKKISPLPLSNVPYVLVPFLVGYQADFAYGTKSARVNEMAKRIRKEEDFWFNEPFEIPELLKKDYYSMMEESNKKLREMGKPEEKHWGR